MNKKHFIPPIIEQWINNINNENYSTFTKENYLNYLEHTRNAIDNALSNYKMTKNKKTK